MRKQEGYWTFKAPDTPEFSELPDGTFAGTEAGWNSLTPRIPARDLPKRHQEIFAAYRGNF